MSGQEKSLAGSTAVMASGTLVSRILGFARAAALTAAIGVLSHQANAFDTANRLPDFFYAIIAGGVLNAILVPQIVRAYQGRGGDAFVSRLLTLGVVALAAVTAILTLSAGLLITFYTKGWPAGQKALAVSFALWCLPQLFFYGLYTLFGQLLNARGSFGPYMWAPVVNNIVAIAGLVAFIVLYGRENAAGKVHAVGTWTFPQIALLAGCTTLGVVLQALVLLIPIRRLKIKLRPDFRWRGAGLGSAARVAVWTLAALIMEQIATWLAYKMASGATQAAGGAMVPANATLTYALTIYVIPHSLITVSLTTALFTTMSQAAGRGDIAAVRRTLSYGIRTTSAFTLFASAFLITLGAPLCRLLFFAVDRAAVEAISRALIPLSLGLVPLGITLLIKRVFFAFEDGRTVFAFQVPMSLLFMAGCLVSVYWLEPQWWVVGIGLAQTLSYIAGVVLRLDSLRFRIGGVDGRRVAWLLARCTVAALVAGEVGHVIVQALPPALDSLASSALTLAAAGLAMVLVYGLCLRTMAVRELSDFLGPALTRLTRRGKAKDSRSTMN
ncbi:MAG: murein biosynthesis integral membrane protein MurJ [Micrococcales bacterium]|nr:murein biosynthesis integral membrane protein MurJ [Micrococcales bacterium]